MCWRRLGLVFYRDGEAVGRGRLGVAEGGSDQPRAALLSIVHLSMAANSSSKFIGFSR